MKLKLLSESSCDVLMLVINYENPEKTAQAQNDEKHTQKPLSKTKPCTCQYRRHVLLFYALNFTLKILPLCNKQKYSNSYKCKCSHS